MIPGQPLGRHDGRPVELLRSCYSINKWRMESGVLVPRRFVYFWADPNKQWYGRNSFGSSNYDAPGLAPREGADLSGQARRWVCGSLACARAQCLAPTITGGASWSLTNPCVGLAGTMPELLFCDVIVTVGDEQPDTFAATFVLTYHNPWQMTAPFGAFVKNGSQTIPNQVMHLFFPDTVTCSYTCNLITQGVGSGGYFLGTQTIDLHQRSVPSLPWQAPTVSYQLGSKTATIRMAFHA